VEEVVNGQTLSDLILRKELTTFGEVVYQIRLRLAVAVDDRWKLKALDTIYSD
jgi:prephenate dehydratase